MTPQSFSGRVKVKAVRGTDILLISYQDRDPETAAKVVNRLMEIYIQENIRSNRSEATAAREFITKQLPRTEANVRNLESTLKSFKEENNIVNLEEESKAAVTLISQLETEVANQKVQLDATIARIREIQNRVSVDSQSAFKVNSLSQSPGVQQALDQLQLVESQLAMQRARFQDSAPAIIKLKEQQDGLKALLRERIGAVIGEQTPPPNRSIQANKFQQELLGSLVTLEVDRLSTLTRINSTLSVLQAYRRRASLLPSLEQRQQDLKRQVSAAQSTYEALLKNLQQVQIIENQNVGNARVVNLATIPTSASSPNRRLFIVAGVVVGGLLYVVVAFLCELMDRSLKRAKDIRELFQLPILRMIPLERKEPILGRLSDYSTHPSRTSSYRESYRMLQTNLEFLKTDRPLKTIVVTSSIGQEGKSTITANLAYVMAQMGDRVLVIDADFRQSIQHLIWTLPDAPGVSDVMKNPAKAAFAIQSVRENLDVLTCGNKDPDALPLLSFTNLEPILQDLDQNYDWILIDTPPLLLVADAFKIAKYTDGILLVARPGLIDSVSAAATRDLLQQSKQPVLGVVVNGVTLSDEPESYFHHAKKYLRKVSI